MSTEAETKKPETPASTKYTLTIGAIAILAEILPTTTWYKEDSKPGQLMGRSFAACEALPDFDDRPIRTKEESEAAFDKRLDAWADPEKSFEWTDKQRDAVKTCVRYYMKQGAFVVTKHAIGLLKMLQLDDE